MKRLLDTPEEGDATRLAAARVLRHVPLAAEVEPSKRRVRARMAARSARKTTARFGRLALLCTLLVAGAAGARGVDRGAWNQARERITAWLKGQDVSARATATSKSPLASGSRRDNPPAVVAPPAAALPVAEIEASKELQPLPVHSAQAKAAPAPKTAASALAAPPASAAPPPSEPGSELMVAAMRARSAGDLPGAERLLSEYRRRFPNGALAEEALVLSVETAALRGSQVAPELARAYLKRFPQGRYRTWVERTLAAAPH